MYANVLHVAQGLPEYSGEKSILCIICCGMFELNKLIERYPCHELHSLSDLCVCVCGGGGMVGCSTYWLSICKLLILMGDFPTVGSCDFCISVAIHTHSTVYTCMYMA